MAVVGPATLGTFWDDVSDQEVVVEATDDALRVALYVAIKKGISELLTVHTATKVSFFKRPEVVANQAHVNKVVNYTMQLVVGWLARHTTWTRLSTKLDERMLVRLVTVVAQKRKHLLIDEQLLFLGYSSILHPQHFFKDAGELMALTTPPTSADTWAQLAKAVYDDLNGISKDAVKRSREDEKHRVSNMFSSLVDAGVITEEQNAAVQAAGNVTVPKKKAAKKPAAAAAGAGAPAAAGAGAPAAAGAGAPAAAGAGAAAAAGAGAAAPAGAAAKPPAKSGVKGPPLKVASKEVVPPGSNAVAAE